MLTPSQLRNLVSGRQTGPRASLLRGALRLAETPYSWAMHYRNHRYDSGRSESYAVGVPVVSVGNISLGGTGKTPLVEWLARKVGEMQRRVVIVSRGYGSEQGKQNDEALELELALPSVPHIQNPDRVAAAKVAVVEHAAQVILLDDGFQHRRLRRDLDIVLLDATEPFGFDHVFPRGTLREPLSGLARADVVILSRADLLNQTQRNTIRARVADLAPRAVWCEVRHRISALINSDGQQVDSNMPAGKRVAAFCGIGNPAGFQHTLNALDCELICMREFPDHHNYSSADIASLSDWGQEAEVALTTRKDLVKLRVPTLGSIPLWAVGVEIDFLVGQQEFEERLLRLTEMQSAT
ncbi:Tetraacyldisaccharide 4'-kinase [Bythopirellula polymerisocia]|uniref:Tetraacyldisaccharide 4'-kinase n=2 Tax=Bythopirellula polymerisocia TaxID=2528003 RepID=A0A5C6CER2_9BACT|nr:Tetraacyldisaccharide 4'-kinase [Bythopirellula polymerisocia]